MNELELRIKKFEDSDYCKLEVRTEHFCRYTFPVLMQHIDCPYYKWNINPILSECKYKSMLKEIERDNWNKIIQD